MKTYLAAALLTGLLAGSAGATTIDFSAMADGTMLTNQIPGVVFSLQGGPDASGSPLVSSVWSGGVIELNNSNSGLYPSASILDIAFTSGTAGISFNYNNYGDNSGFYTAYDASYNVVSTGFLGDLSDDSGSFYLVHVAGSGIVDLKIDNDYGGDDWVFGLRSLSFGAVPEPASWALMIGGFGMVGAKLRRRRAAAAA